jgi:hypothetical protein
MAAQRASRWRTVLWAACCLAVPVWMFVQLGPGPVEGADPETIARGARLDELMRSHQAVSFATLGAFDYRPELPMQIAVPAGYEPIPPAIQALDGKLVWIEGFMLPLDFNEGGVSRFILNANYDMCAYGAPALLNQQVEVVIADGRRTLFTHRGIRVFGRFAVGEDRTGGRVVSLYRMVASAIQTEG